MSKLRNTEHSDWPKRLAHHTPWLSISQTNHSANETPSTATRGRAINAPIPSVPEWGGVVGTEPGEAQTPDYTVVFSLEPDPPATTTGRTLVSRKLPADHGNNALGFTSVMLRSKRDLHLFKHSTFTFILDESIPGQKLSLWATVHRSKTLSSSGAIRTPQLPA